MKTSKHRRITPSSSSAAFERDARREIEHFRELLIPMRIDLLANPI